MATQRLYKFSRNEMLCRRQLMDIERKTTVHLS